MGAQRPAIRFRQLEIPLPVPRLGAGKTSGVYAYRTPYIIFWKKFSREEQTSWMSGSVEAVKQKIRTPVIRVAVIIVPLRPMYLMSTVQHARMEPGRPTIEVMA